MGTMNISSPGPMKTWSVHQAPLRAALILFAALHVVGKANAACAGHHGCPSVQGLLGDRGRALRDFHRMLEAAGPQAVEGAGVSALLSP